MLATCLLTVVLLQDSTAAYDGRSHRIQVDIPRVDTSVAIDGRLDEPIWRRAAKLSGFSQYQPSDGRPAEDNTDVMVWYASDAIYFGIRAREKHAGAALLREPGQAVRAPQLTVHNTNR